MRQLFRSCVLPIIDYAALAWFGLGQRGTTRLCNQLDKVTYRDSEHELS
jgi:hypothetical protein